MDINVHRAKRVTAKYHSQGTDYAFAVLNIEEADDSTVSLFVREENKDFLVQLMETTSEVLGVLVYGVAPPGTDEEE